MVITLNLLWLYNYDQYAYRNHYGHKINDCSIATISIIVITCYCLTVRMKNSKLFKIKLKGKHFYIYLILNEKKLTTI